MCKSPPPKTHPDVPVPPTPLCTPVNGTLVVGTSAAIAMTPSQTQVWRFLAPTTRTYVFSAVVVVGFNAFQGHVRVDHVLCCASGSPDLCPFGVGTPGTSAVLTANHIYLVCISNAVGSNSYKITIT